MLSSKIAICLSVLLLSSGCQMFRTKTIYVAPGDPVQIREPIRGAAVWMNDEKGNRVPGYLDIPAGWWALPLGE